MTRRWARSPITLRKTENKIISVYNERHFLYVLGFIFCALGIWRSVTLGTGLYLNHPVLEVAQALGYFGNWSQFYSDNTRALCTQTNFVIEKNYTLLLLDLEALAVERDNDLDLCKPVGNKKYFKRFRAKFSLFSRAHTGRRIKNSESGRMLFCFPLDCGAGQVEFKSYFSSCVTFLSCLLLIKVVSCSDGGW